MLRATLQQLRLFEAVARNRSFTQAANEVHLSQPAVSIQVKRLEGNIGEPLLEQMGKKIYLTEVGKQLYAMCDDVFSRMNDFEQQLEALKGEVAGPLTIGVATTAKYFLPGLLGKFLSRYPKVKPKLKVTNLTSILARMEENTDDLYIVATLPEKMELVCEGFLDDGLYVCAHPSHPLVGQKNIPLDVMADQLLLAREPGSATRKGVEEYFSEKGVKLKPHMELGSGEAIKQGVMAGIGVGVQSGFSLELETKSNRMVILDFEGLPIHRRWHVAYLKGKKLSLAAQHFIEFLRNADADELIGGIELPNEALNNR